MKKPMEAKKSPEVKPWVHRVVEAAGVSVPSNVDGERRLGWWWGDGANLYPCDGGRGNAQSAG